MNRKKRIFCAVLAAFLAVTMLLSIIVIIINAVNADAASEYQLNALKAAAQELADKKEEVNRQIAQLQSERASIIERKNKIDENIRLTEQEIENLTLQIEVLEDDIAEKTRQYDLAVSEEERQMGLFRERVREMEENGDISYFEIIFQATSFTELLSVMDSITDVMNYDEWVVEQLNGAQEATLAARGELEDAKTEAENSKKEQLAKEEQLKTELEEASELMSAIENDINTYSVEYAELEEAEEEAAKRVDEMIAALEEERRRQQLASVNVNATGAYLWPAPASKYVTSPFGTRLHPVYKTYRTHYGVDIGASYGTNILAADGGTVVTSQLSSSYGNYVMIDHGGGNYTLYAHMSSRLVSVGDDVTKGQVIGLVGSTGVSTGPHLHFEVYESGTRVDPLQYFTDYIPLW